MARSALKFDDGTYAALLAAARDADTAYPHDNPAFLDAFLSDAWLAAHRIYGAQRTPDRAPDRTPTPWAAEDLTAFDAQRALARPRSHAPGRNGGDRRRAFPSRAPWRSKTRRY